MKLICCEVRSIVGLMSVATETGMTPQAVKRILTKRGVKHVSNAGFNSCSCFPSVLVQEAFRDVPMPLTSSENGV